MQLVAENTNIPLPKIHAYQLGDDSHALSSFLILEYIEGRSISPSQLDSLTNDQRTRLYTSLASVYLQLRRLEFPSIGCLARGYKGFEVGKRPATIDLNMQELEGLQPSTIQTRYGNHGILSSANGYTAMLLEISDNAFSKTRSRVLDQDHGEDALYHHDLFRRFVVDEWLDTKLNSGPFVLVHGDLQLFNCLVNEQMEVVSILDWEWSRVVPRQFFQPPLWLTNRNPGALSWDYAYSRFLESFDEFLDVTRALERKMYGNELLSDEWTEGKDGFLVANALENWTEIDLFSADFISWKWYRGKADMGERIKIFMEEDPARRFQVSQLVQKHHDYKGELRKLRQENPDNGGNDEITEGFSLQGASTAFLGRAKSFYSRLCAVFPVSSTTVALAVIVIATATHFRTKRN
ncbi:hypothetical protein QQX98_009144 [Neonectria punicea]|uniref:Aminoglycoside phosphotransferase domain-containing protein n=1 Tax=Neonectria punicea TaxID=979145 RepID=A0ABR1GT40_9HYPO